MVIKRIILYIYIYPYISINVYVYIFSGEFVKRQRRERGGDDGEDERERGGVQREKKVEMEVGAVTIGGGYVRVGGQGQDLGLFEMGKEEEHRKGHIFQ